MPQPKRHLYCVRCKEHVSKRNYGGVGLCKRCKNVDLTARVSATAPLLRAAMVDWYATGTYEFTATQRQFIHDFFYGDPQQPQT